MKFPAAVLWDMDGTLVDTEPVWIAGEQQLAAKHGAVWTDEDSLAIVGADLRNAADYIRRRTGVDLSPEEIIAELGDQVRDSLVERIDWRPGALELFRELDDAGVPQALVTMSYRHIAQPVINELPFAAVVTGDDVRRGKPDPEPYLRAVELLEVEAVRSLAIEDSGTGAASADAAGCHVLGVPYAVEVPAGPRRTIVNSLAGISVHDLAGFLGNTI